MRRLVQMNNIIMDFVIADQTNRVLHDITTQFYSGELTMLVGPSGCGKTTFLSIISGILSPSQGQVFIDNINLTALSDREKVIFRRQNFGFVFQQFNLLPALTAAENTAIPLLATGLSFNQAVESAYNMLKKVGMELHANKLPKQLSGGQQQRVAFARALVHQPKVIVCDEPTSALDANNGKKVMEALKAIAVQPDCAVIVVTHDDRIFHFANRIIHMNDGKIETEETNDKKYVK